MTDHDTMEDARGAALAQLADRRPNDAVVTMLEHMRAYAGLDQAAYHRLAMQGWDTVFAGRDAVARWITGLATPPGALAIRRRREPPCEAPERLPAAATRRPDAVRQSEEGDLFG